MLDHDLPHVDNESKVKLARTVVVREVREAVDLAAVGGHLVVDWAPS